MDKKIIGQSKAILISTEMYEQLTMDRQSILDAIETSDGLLEGLKDYRRGKILSKDQFFTKMAQKYGKHKKG